MKIQENDYDKLIEEILKSVNYLVAQTIKNITVIYDGLVLSQNNNNTWNIQYNGEIHAVQLYGNNTPTINSVVKVIIPQGNQALAWFFIP